MRIAYLTTYNSGDINQWSGTGYYMCRSLALQGVDVVPINCEVPYTTWQLIKKKVIKIFFGQVYQLDRNPAYLKKLAAKAEEKLKHIKHDLILSPGSLPISFLNTTKPIIFWADATYDSMVDFYPSWRNISKESYKNGNMAEQMAIDKASLILYTSHWAVRNSLEKYGADPLKVKRVPVGSNLESHINYEGIKKLIQKRQQKKVLNLLLIGVDWERKGGSMAVDVVTRLVQLGFPATLTLVGLDVPNYVRNLPFVEYYGYISKSTQEGIDQLNAFYEKATFFILPTMAECFGVVFAEAGSFALPVITSNVGGCGSTIKSGYNGYCLGLEGFVDKAVDNIVALHELNDDYRTMSLNAFELFENELNWKVIGKKAYEAMKPLLSQKEQSVE